MSTEDFLKVNRERWDELSPLHADSDYYDVEGFKAGGIRLSDYEIEEVGDVTGKSLLHLLCHIGTDTLSWARLGARVTGADFSEEAVAVARRLATDVGIDARFVASDVYRLGDVLDEKFDIVYTSRGVLGWLPDLDGWAEVVADLLDPGGIFYITEIHPIAQVFDEQPGASQLKVTFPYFTTEDPVPILTQGSYAARDAEVKNKLEFGWPHGLGEVATALVRAGLRIDFLHEFPFTYWDKPFLTEVGPGRWGMPEDKGEMPLMFSIKATKR
ncbi:MAG TPA: class I SAM-dependent methyltransferase [Actinomycetota bacterium]|nr:class I SAM-dependent methyltransferase [Actinomycetota bacterium]